MIAVRTALCPVDFSAASARQVDLAADVCRAFGARLVLHHNVKDVSASAGVGWMWHADHAPTVSADAAGRLSRLAARLPKGLVVETCVTSGAIITAVMVVAEAAEADLVVLSEHAGKTEDHESVIETLLERSNRAVLALHDPGADLALPRFASAHDHNLMQAILVPANLTTDSHPSVEVAFDLARLLPLRVHLLHVIEPRPVRDLSDADPASIKPRLAALVPADLAPRTTVHVEEGDPVPAIVAAAKRLGVSCIVMGEHTRVPLKRWLTRDTARAVLHGAPCPVWYVPSVRVAGTWSFERFALSREQSILWGNV
ncbi:MAG TPA: universal stress protein [Vicinamibacterales bacterium]|nr:universal stress protein [Vicinamibacterales bacterium]